MQRLIILAFKELIKELKIHSPRFIINYHDDHAIVYNRVTEHSVIINYSDPMGLSKAVEFCKKEREFSIPIMYSSVDIEERIYKILLNYGKELNSIEIHARLDPKVDKIVINEALWRMLDDKLLKLTSERNFKLL